MSVSERNIGMLQRETILTVTRIRLDDVIWKYSQREKLQFFNFLLLFSIIKRKSRQTTWRAVYISMRGTLNIFIFCDTYKKKKVECSSEFFNFIPIDLE